jgi:hypothetical protein
MIPSLLGNILGGGLFVGVTYWYLYLCGEEQEVLLDASGIRQRANPDILLSGATSVSSTNTQVAPDEKARSQIHAMEDIEQARNPVEKAYPGVLVAEGRFVSSIGVDLRDGGPTTKKLV